MSKILMDSLLTFDGALFTRWDLSRRMLSFDVVQVGCVIYDDNLSVTQILEIQNKTFVKYTTSGTTSETGAKMETAGLGIYDLVTNYKPYSIVDRIDKNKKSGELIQVQNTEKSKERKHIQN